jgi:hypothetical protein
VPEVLFFLFLFYKEFRCMLSSAIPDIIDALLLLVSIFITVRALYLYGRVRTPRLLILGFSMALLAITAAADYASGHITSIALNTDWFLYVGQAVCFLFILLSLVNGSEDYLHRLTRWQVVVSLLALLLLLASPVLPGFPNPAIKTVLSGLRCVLCFAIFFSYTAAFMSKQTRFSLLMGLAFLLLSFGYLVILQQYVDPNAVLLDNIGDVVRMGGLISLLVAVITG